MQQDPPFDLDDVFDEDYLFFYETFLTPERTEQEVESIWRLLGLEAGQRVLDLACGHGRIANRLAQRGCQVTGLDRSPYFLELARRDAEARGVRVDYRQGDMRSLPWSDEFDRVVSWFTSFGYFGDAGNHAVLAEAYRALKAGGRLLVDQPNRDRLLREFQPFEVIERDGRYQIDRARYDAESGYAETERTVVKPDGQRRMRFSVRLFTFPELKDWLRQAGFVEVQGFEEPGRPYALAARRLRVVATK